MKGIFKFNTDINTLWDYIEDFEKQKLWMEGLIDIKYVEPKDSKHLKAYIVTIKEGSKNSDYYGYTEISNKPNKLRIIMQNDNFTTTTEYNLSQEGDIAILSYDASFVSHKLIVKIIFGIIGFLFSKIMMKKFMNNLKKLVEKN